MKIIASDYDGTITYDSESMLEKNKKAIAAWRKAGNYFGIVTGRGAESIGLELEIRDIVCDFILANNGSLCLMNGEILFEEKIDGTAAASVLKTVYSFGCEMLGYDIGIKPHGQLNNYDGGEILFEFLKNAYFTQFNTVCHGETLEEAEKKARLLCELIVEKHGETLNPLLNGRCIDICRAGCDKGTGIARLADILDVEYDNIYAVGDNFNDLAMLKRFNSFAMNNACDEVKKYASAGIAGSVAEMIKRLL